MEIRKCVAWEGGYEQWSRPVVSDSLRPHGLQPTRLFCPWVFQARILEWVAISFSRRSSRPRDWTRVSRIVGRHFTVWATKEVPNIGYYWLSEYISVFVGNSLGPFHHSSMYTVFTSREEPCRDNSVLHVILSENTGDIGRLSSDNI